MPRNWVLAGLLLVSALTACSADAGTTPEHGVTSAPDASSPTAPIPVVPSRTAPATAVLVGAGDIASCDSTGDSRTAALLERTPGIVFTLGDNAYPTGSSTDFSRCYKPAWGRVKARTRPVVGNHEYATRGAAAYFDYFGAAAGPRGKGYYSYQAGAWHVVVLNTNCDSVPGGGCRRGSAQERWLRADLATSNAACTVAMVHHPLYTSAAAHPPATETRPLVQALYDAGAEILLAGHNHVYERFAPQTPAGRRDNARGIREIVAGTGGAALYPFGPTAANSERRNDHTFGVVRLTLSPGSYQWDFLPASGHFTDTGHGTCH
jgi:calcineurin-like phosphoesterase family protein